MVFLYDKLQVHGQLVYAPHQAVHKQRVHHELAVRLHLTIYWLVATPDLPSGAAFNHILDSCCP